MPEKKIIFLDKSDMIRTHNNTNLGPLLFGTKLLNIQISHADSIYFINDDNTLTVLKKRYG